MEKEERKATQRDRKIKIRKEDLKDLKHFLKHYQNKRKDKSQKCLLLKKYLAQQNIKDVKEKEKLFVR